MFHNPLEYSIQYSSNMINTEQPNERLTFQEELENLINKHSQENASNTPDFILARFLNECLDAYNTALQARDKWFNFTPFQHQTHLTNE